MFDVLDLFFPSLFWDEEPEELKKRFDRILERYKEQRRALASSHSSTLRFGDTEEQFRAEVQKLAEMHKDKEVKAHSVEFPNGYYRSVIIRSKK